MELCSALDAVNDEVDFDLSFVSLDIEKPGDGIVDANSEITGLQFGESIFSEDVQIELGEGVEELFSSKVKLLGDSNGKRSSLTKALREVKRCPRSKRDTVSDPQVESDHSSGLQDGPCLDAALDTGIYSPQTHKNESSVEKSYQCLHCGKCFREKSHLATHSRAHIDVRKFKCDKCGLSFKTKCNLKFHMGTHSETPFTCDQCLKIYSDGRSLRRHIRLVHKSENFVCDQCGRKFKNESSLVGHYSLHTGSKPHQCTLCEKSFVYRSTLSAHMRDHDMSKTCRSCCESGETLCTHSPRAWLCTVCGKRFRFKGTLNSHMKTHQANKPYKCAECGKSFMKKQSYEVHMKQHRGEGPQFMCDQCSLSYFNQFSLRRHYMKHTSSKSFVCKVCSKSFWMKDALKVHMRTHSNCKLFKCPTCGKGFNHRHTFDAHCRSSHTRNGQAVNKIPAPH